jgi:hypothetical protein
MPPSWWLETLSGRRGSVQRIRRRNKGKGSESEVVPRETRSYEYAHVNALWHFDFHEGKRKVLTATGERKTPYLFGLLDDCSRVCCHAQWYLERENTEDLVHVSTIATDRGALTKSRRHDRSIASPRALVATTAMANSLSGVSPG